MTAKNSRRVAVALYSPICSIDCSNHIWIHCTKVWILICCYECMVKICRLIQSSPCVQMEIHFELKHQRFKAKELYLELLESFKATAIVPGSTEPASQLYQVLKVFSLECLDMELLPTINAEIVNFGFK
jgi:hypothetical protein